MNARRARWIAGLTVSTLLLGAVGAQAQVYTNVYLDDFSQFANGTVLASNNFATSYTPTAGLEASVTNNSPGPLTGVISTTNLFGSMGAWWNVPTNSGFTYQGAFNQTASNIGTRISWDMAMSTTNATMGGGLFLMMPPNNVLNQNQPLVGFFDNGAIFIFTNTPGPTSLEQIGTFTPNVLHANQVDYNLSLGTYNLSVDGLEIVTNQPIPDYLNAKAIDGVTLSYDTQFSDFGNSNPNQIFIDNVIVAVPEPSSCALIGVGALGLLLRRRRRRRF